jgi:GNAT superfamily N-acetyltransferase
MQDDVTVREIAPSDRRNLKSFASLGRRLLAGNPILVPEIESDVVDKLSGRSAYFDAMDWGVFTARKDGKDVAGCAAFINRRYQEAKGEAVGFIGYLAMAREDEEASRKLFSHAESWLKDRGVTRVITPYNGAANIRIGLLTANYDSDPVFPFDWHPPYYARYLSDFGYNPTYPFWCYTVDFESEEYRTSRARAEQNDGVVVRPVSRKKWAEDFQVFVSLFNETLKDEWEFHPYSVGEMHETFDGIKSMLDPRHMLIAELEGTPAGLCFGMPDWTPHFRSLNGRLGPLRVLRLISSAGMFARAGLLGIGVLREYRGFGVARALAISLYSAFEERGLRKAFYYLVNDHNTASRRFAESLGGTGQILYHCYDKTLR